MSARAARNNHRPIEIDFNVGRSLLQEILILARLKQAEAGIRLGAAADALSRPVRLRFHDQRGEVREG